MAFVVTPEHSLLERRHCLWSVFLPPDFFQILNRTEGLRDFWTYNFLAN
jgi:hypothetical protein